MKNHHEPRSLWGNRTHLIEDSGMDIYFFLSLEWERSIVIKLPSYDTLDESELKQVHNTTEIIKEGQNEIEVESITSE